MQAVRRALGVFLLVCVVLALGDAPYVDEFFDDLAAAQPAAASRSGGAPVSPKPFSGSSRICQNLLNLSVAPDAIRLVAPAGRCGFPDTISASFSSATLRRIDRPPAATVHA